MSIESPVWSETLVRLLALATALENDGQYNIAKLARAAADSMARRAAYEQRLPDNADAPRAALDEIARALPAVGIDEALIAALQRGAAALAEGRVPLIGETPHPYVCRTCGHVTLAPPAENCPSCGAWPGSYQRFMPNYWFDALEPPAALAVLRQTPVEVAGLLRELPEAALSRGAADGGWAIRNTVAHLRDSQVVLAYRVDLFLNEEHPRLASQAVWAWAEDDGERPLATAEIFEAYRASRAQTVAALEDMPVGYWQRTGEHEEFGAISLRQHVSYFAAHEVTHLPQIAALRGGA